jgi:phenylacetic acid degradation operon negative regulatory protein
MSDHAFPVLQQRLDDFRGLVRMQSGSLITSVFGDVVLPRGGQIWLGSLIRLLAPLGLNERLVRTTVFRLLKEEWLSTQAQGRRTDYHLTPAGEALFLQASEHIYAPASPRWDHQWRLLLLVGDLPPKARDPLRRALFWQGFGDLGQGKFVHPSADLKSVMASLSSSGLGAHLHALLPLQTQQLDAPQTLSDRDVVAKAWDLRDLAGRYRQFDATYRPILEELLVQGPATLSPDLALELRTLLIHDFRRLLLRDPELPQELLPADWPGHGARALCRSIYGHVLHASELHLDACFQLSDGSVPKAGAILNQRFSSSR